MNQQGDKDDECNEKGAPFVANGQQENKSHHGQDDVALGQGEVDPARPEKGKDVAIDRR